MEDMQPGKVVSPRSESVAPATLPQPLSAQAPEQPAELPQPAAANPNPATELQPSPTIPYHSEQVPAPQADWQAQSDQLYAPSQVSHQQPLGHLEWIGAEFIAHDKSAGWYTVVMVAGLIGAAIIYMLTKDKLSVAIVVFTMVAFAAVAARKPREQRYALDDSGLAVGNHMYHFHDFKSFSIADEGSVASVVLMPLKRFMPPLTIYVPLEKEAAVTDHIAQFLPFEQHKADAVDTLVRRIRF